MSMESYIYLLAYIGYISISSVIAYPLLKDKSQLPNGGVVDMVFINFFILGAMPFIALLMKHPPKNPGIAESYEYYEQGKIWKWNK